MATHWRSILGVSLGLDSPNKVTIEPYSRLATNDLWKYHIIRIDEDGANNAQLTTKAGFHFNFRVPDTYVGAAKFRIEWTATVTTGNVVFDVDYRVIAGDDANSMDQATAQESLTVTDAAPTAAHRRLVAEVSATAGNFAAGDRVEVIVSCDGVDAADTLAAARIIFDALFGWADA